MSRDVSLTFREAIFAQETDEAFLVLLTIDHETLTTPIRATSDGVNTTSRGDVYYQYPFGLVLPDDVEDRPARARLVIDNIDRSIVQTLRAATSPPTVTMEIVLASDPDTVEASFEDFELVNADYNVLTITGELSIESFANEPFPGDIFSPARFPGLF